MKKYITTLLFLILLIPVSCSAKITDGETMDCGKLSVVEGDSENIIGCGKATTFGHKTDGSKDGSKDDGNVFCNPKNEKEKFTFRNDRSTQENLQVKFAALRAQDIGKIFRINVSGNLKQQLKTLAKKRNDFCGKMIKVKDLKTGNEITVKLMDVMSNNNKLIDLTGGAMKELGGKGKEPTLNKVQITWANAPTN